MNFSWFKLVPKSLDGMFWHVLDQNIPSTPCIPMPQLCLEASATSWPGLQGSSCVQLLDEMQQKDLHVSHAAWRWGYLGMALQQSGVPFPPFPTYFCNRNPCNRAIFERSYVRNVVNLHFGPSGPCVFTCVYWWMRNDGPTDGDIFIFNNPMAEVFSMGCLLRCCQAHRNFCPPDVERWPLPH